MSLSPPLVPHNGHTLKVLCPGRVSSVGPGKQDIRSLDDQQSIQDRWLEQHTSLPVEITVIAGSGSGEWLERLEYTSLLEKIESREYDLVLTEDLGRIVRRTYAFWVCELCEDHGVRLISINNQNVDTAQPGWRDAAFFAAYFYEKDNQDKSLRLKGRLRSRFEAGGALERRIYGYVDPPDGAKHESERKKDPDAEEVYKEWFKRLEEGASYQEIADWLKESEVPTGRYCRIAWDCKMVARITHNAILKGVRRHNLKKTRRINATGKYKSEQADPSELLTRTCPHLAFFEEEYYDRVTTITKFNNSKFKPGKNGIDPRRGRPKKQTVWPGQHIYCGVCGRLYRYGGNGQKDHLLCRGACEYNCWNSITVDGPLAARKLSDAIMREIVALPEFDSDYLQRLEMEVSALQKGHGERLAKINKRLAKVTQQMDNLSDAIAKIGLKPHLQEKYESLESQQAELYIEKKEVTDIPESKIHLPEMAQIREMAFGAFHDLSIESIEFSRLIRMLVSRIVVYPVRLIDGGHIELRARFLLNLVPLIENAKHIQGMSDVLRRWLVVDLLNPPQRAEFREQVAVEKAKNKERPKKDRLNEYQIGEKLGITHTAVQRASALQRKMDRLSIVDPYEVVTEPPPDYTKLRRHKHSRFKFEPEPHVELY